MGLIMSLYVTYILHYYMQTLITLRCCGFCVGVAPEAQLRTATWTVMLQNENGCRFGGNNTPADGSHACASAHRLVWNYDDARGAGILFSVSLMRKQEQANTKKEHEAEDGVCGLTCWAACGVSPLQFTLLNQIMVVADIFEGWLW